MRGNTLGHLLNSETASMRMVLTDNKIPNTTVFVPKITPYYIGQFMTMNMLNVFFDEYQSS